MNLLIFQNPYEFFLIFEGITRPLYTPEKWAIFGDFSYDSYNRYPYDYFWAR